MVKDSRKTKEFSCALNMYMVNINKKALKITLMQFNAIYK